MTTTYKVEIQHRGNTYTIDVPEDQTILEAAHENQIDLPTSCGAGVCTTCAALITEGTVTREEGIGLSPDLQEEGYALLCVAYPSSDVKLESDKEEAVYDRQFGQSS
ncbi:ferredoxin (2Fe-2S) [[Leptolyngbya] sp. PCC 7376]|uniref:2Fe-2S iron-sulfur cluster-binding protein n=1 Tax=[Leptolyngbya] sp. PCC 7376 TaxID=111781 RepID=UPI00029F3C21|nr:2Fe-2S iron-sulfur cluster-binding protein [[Leptolyngbya] sp. PCC 7376]AFY38766.1 ferredoxin (2Fe-2S) [[Leptolyngbya] sp. PCC 7376]